MGGEACRQGLPRSLCPVLRPSGSVPKSASYMLPSSLFRTRAGLLSLGAYPSLPCRVATPESLIYFARPRKRQKQHLLAPAGRVSGSPTWPLGTWACFPFAALPCPPCLRFSELLLCVHMRLPLPGFSPLSPLRLLRQRLA